MYIRFDANQISKSLAPPVKLPKIAPKGNLNLTIRNLHLAIDLLYLIALDVVSVEEYKARSRIF